MATHQNEPGSRWGPQLQDATERVEQDLRRVITYINDEVVPDIRRSGSQALRTAAAELQRLAQRMDDSRGPNPSAPGSSSAPGSTADPSTGPSTRPSDSSRP
jgi:hypothetical protein